MLEKHRPTLHFAPARGWMNDPNGMIHIDGVYHLFFQHDPDSVAHGPMHWGHATSRDLVHWQEAPIALRPDRLGTCFSGSAIVTPEGHPKLLYTAHRKDADGQDFQVQCLVHADRALSTFTSEPSNPVLDNPGLVAFRDPKVIWLADKRHWIMVVTHGREIGFYASTDLLSWRLESTFGQGALNRPTGVWECPDLLPLRTTDGETAWILVVSLGSNAYGGGSGTLYFVGDFDGHRFTSRNGPDTELWLDHGRDFYAPQSFFDPEAAQPTLMAWANNWQYARALPAERSRGQMGLPRTLALVETPSGLRLAQRVPAIVRQAFADSPSATGTFVADLSIDLTQQAGMGISLFGESEPAFVIRRQGPGGAEIRVRRAGHGLPDFATDYGMEVPLAPDGRLELSLYCDRGLVELTTADGLVWISMLFLPATPEGPLDIRALA